MQAVAKGLMGVKEGKVAALTDTKGIGPGVVRELTNRSSSFVTFAGHGKAYILLMTLNAKRQ